MSPAGECNPDSTENENRFQITYAYWNESGRPTVDESATNDSEIGNKLELMRRMSKQILFCV